MIHTSVFGSKYKLINGRRVYVKKFNGQYYKKGLSAPTSGAKRWAKEQRMKGKKARIVKGKGGALDEVYVR